MSNIENKEGSLTRLMRQVQENAALKQDFTAPTKDLQLETQITDGDNANKSQVIIEATGGEPTKILTVNDVALQQIASKSEIDIRTVRRLRDHYPAELDSIIKSIWDKENKGVMLRTFVDKNDSDKGVLRAFTSSSYKVFDNEDVLTNTLPQLIDSPADWQVVNGNITDQRMYLRLKSLNQVADAAVGDAMANGLLISNSEVGLGSVNVQQLIYTLACLNGMQTANKSRSTHVTSSRGTDSWSLLSNEAKTADNQALSLKLRDVVGHFADRESFDQVIEQMRFAHTEKVTGALPSAVDTLCGILKLPKGDNPKVLEGLMATLQQSGYNHGIPSRATFVNAITAIGNQAGTLEDNRDEWSRLGGKVLNLAPNQWHSVAVAA